MRRIGVGLLVLGILSAAFIVGIALRTSGEPKPETLQSAREILFDCFAGDGVWFEMPPAKVAAWRKHCEDKDAAYRETVEPLLVDFATTMDAFEAAHKDLPKATIAAKWDEEGWVLRKKIRAAIRKK